jgi:hypothetical protein
MYSAVLTAHSWVRWVVLAAAVYAIVRAVGGASRRRVWDAGDDRAGQWFILAVDLQFTMGLLLYLVLSPFTWRVAQQLGMGAAMRDADTRFWLVEHAFGMLIGTALAHVGRARVRKAGDAIRKHRVAATFFILALLAFLLSTPWPGMPNGRPWLRW